jgi:hypothetical protein
MTRVARSLWSCHRSFNGPSVPQSVEQCVVVDVDAFGPVGDAHAYAGVGHDFVTPRISTLLSTCRPSAVVRRIRAIVVDAVQAISDRARTHICKKIKERSPAIYDGNSSSAIVIKAIVVRISAALDHVVPDPYFTFRKFVFALLTFVEEFSSQAAAATRTVISKVSSADDCFVSAGTAAPPHPAIVSESITSVDLSQYAQTAERLTNEVRVHDRRAHSRGLISWTSALGSVRPSGLSLGLTRAALVCLTAFATKRDGVRVLAFSDDHFVPIPSAAERAGNLAQAGEMERLSIARIELRAIWRVPTKHFTIADVQCPSVQSQLLALCHLATISKRFGFSDRRFLQELIG